LPVIVATGVLLMLTGITILVGLGLGIYTQRGSVMLMRTGIPTILLSEFVGLTAALSGAAIIAGVVAARRRARR